MNGKGDKRRPMMVDSKQFEDSWERIFGKKSNDDKSDKPKQRAGDNNERT